MGAQKHLEKPTSFSVVFFVCRIKWKISKFTISSLNTLIKHLLFLYSVVFFLSKLLGKS